ncbi:CDGSH iron-sulfur domain-containing protein NEET [Canna indica]|uniref:CDGSH iron-sulfur domain-containing protein NEET n=1 Tax=Canna indica TaxID=4628 RepID=A0AAQ3QAP5_9LILI|nr:CDGSH iron-sulfur domain-containing protein NEET [Canna indica]
MASSVMATMGAPLSYRPSSVEGLHRNRAASSVRLPRRSSAFTVRAEGGINPDVRKDEQKVVDSVVVSELAKPLTAYCRCWRSGTFPLCDGSHVKHNKATGDNVGPLLVKK